MTESTLTADSGPVLVDIEDTPLEAGTIGVAEPRTRWAGIIWGLVLAAIAGGGLWFFLADDSSASLTPWIMSLTPFTIAIYIVMGIASVAVITALVLLIRFAQRNILARRARS